MVYGSLFDRNVSVGMAYKGSLIAYSDLDLSWLCVHCVIVFVFKVVGVIICALNHYYHVNITYIFTLMHIHVLKFDNLGHLINDIMTFDVFLVH